MSKCIVQLCKNTTRKDLTSKGIIMHEFPFDPQKIKHWLLLIGQNFGNLDTFAQRIVRARKAFRICSDHFHPDCYILMGNKSTLRDEAVPSIFPKIIDDSDLSIEDTSPPSKRPRVDPLSQDYHTLLEAYNRKFAVGAFSQFKYKNISRTNTVCYKNISRTNTVGPKDVSRTNTVGPKDVSGTNTVGPKDVSRTNTVRYKNLSRINTVGPKDVSSTNTVSYKDASTRTDLYFHTRDAGTRTNPFQGTRTKKISTDPKLGRKNACTTTGHTWLIPPACQDRYVKMVDAYTCTEPELRYPSVAEHWKIRHDHMYPTDDLRSTEDSQNKDSSDSELNGCENPPLKDKVDADKLVNERKFLVFESCLDELLKHLKCSYGNGCSATISGIEKHITGTMLTVVGHCSDGHVSCLWRSQPIKGSTGIGDLICSSAVLFSGSNFQKVHEMFTFIGLPFISPARHSVLQRKYLFPIIDFHWCKEQKRNKISFSSHPLSLVGDGQFGSFGKNRRYCAYTLLESTTKRILDFHIGQSTPLTSSMALEKFAYKSCLDSLLEEGFSIKEISTDKHMALQTLMEKSYDDISYKYDLWKYCKGFRKKLMAASHKSGCAKIAEWIPDLTSHLQYSTSSSQGQEQLIHEKWLSRLYHITGQHRWSYLKEFNACAHPPLTTEENDKLPWLCPKDLAYQHLKEIMTDKMLLEDLSHITVLCHKGQLDLFHSLFLKYVPERTRFHSDTLEARTRLAALAYNYSTQRVNLAVRCRIHKIHSGGFQSHNKVSPKKQEHWLKRYVYGASASAHIFPMISDVIRYANKQIFHSWRLHQMSSNIT